MKQGLFLLGKVEWQLGTIHRDYSKPPDAIGDAPFLSSKAAPKSSKETSLAIAAALSLKLSVQSTSHLWALETWGYRLLLQFPPGSVGGSPGPGFPTGSQTGVALPRNYRTSKDANTVSSLRKMCQPGSGILEQSERPVAFLSSGHHFVLNRKKPLKAPSLVENAHLMLLTEIPLSRHKKQKPKTKHKQSTIPSPHWPWAAAIKEKMLFINIQQVMRGFRFFQFYYLTMVIPDRSQVFKGPLLGPVVHGIRHLWCGLWTPEEVAGSQQGSALPVKRQVLQAKGQWVQASPSVQHPLPHGCQAHLHLLDPAYSWTSLSRLESLGHLLPRPQRPGGSSPYLSILLPPRGRAKTDQHICSHIRNTLIFVTATRPIQLKIITGLFQVFILAKCVACQSQEQCPLLTWPHLHGWSEKLWSTPNTGRSRGFLRCSHTTLGPWGGWGQGCFPRPGLELSLTVFQVSIRVSDIGQSAEEEAGQREDGTAPVIRPGRSFMDGWWSRGGRQSRPLKWQSKC